LINGSVVSLDTGKVLVVDVERAESFFQRSKGLLGRKSLARGQGLLLAPCNSVHTFFMKFPLDIIFLDRDGRVVKLKKRLGPWKVCGCLKASSVLEVAAGLIEEVHLQIGSKLLWREN